MVTVYTNGIITFRERTEGIEVSEPILRANSKGNTFSFEFRWDRKKYFYSATIHKHDSVYSGSFTYLAQGFKIPVRINNGKFIVPLVFNGEWIEETEVNDFTIEFKDMDCVSEDDLPY